MTSDNTMGHPANPDATDGAVGRVARDARAAADIAKHDVKHVADEVRKDASSVIDAAKDQLATITHDAEDLANTRKDSFADNLDGVAAAMSKAADELARDSGPGANLTRQLAGRVRQVSKTLKSNDIGGLIGIAEDFGRQQPAAFLGASVLLGFAVSRFAVASSHRSRPVHSGNNSGIPTNGGTP